MQAYRLEAFGQPLVPYTGEAPRPVGREVLVAIGSSGVCHSDVHLADGWFDLGNGRKASVAAQVAPPRVLGHEIAGTVVAVGPDVHDARPGDRRMVYPWIGCGTCAVCASGDEHLCADPRTLGVRRDGGFADHVLVPDAKYLLDYAPLSEEQACTYACSGLTAYSALKKVVSIGSADRPVVIGAGGVGLSAIRMAAGLGLAAPIVVERDRAKWDLAMQAGAHDVLDPTADATSRSIMKATGGAAAVLDFVGSGETFAFGFGLLRKGGMLVSVGLIGGATSISPALVAMKAARIVGSYVGSPAELRELLALAKTAAWPDLPLVTAPLSQADHMLSELRAGRVRGRAVLKPATPS